MATEDKVWALAIQFSREMRDNLTADQMRHVRRLNGLHDAAGRDVCASHDYCDANQVMLDAALKANIDISDTSDGDVSELVDAAWRLAKGTGFTL